MPTTNDPISAILEKPVFMVGPLRSGSTMLRLMLDRNPQINFFNEFEGAVSEINDGSFPNLKDYYSIVKHDRMMQDLNFDIDESLKYPQLVRSFLKQAYLKKPVAVVGATIHNKFEYIHKLWPEARYIHITRDPRDVARSCIGMGWVGNVFAGAKYWTDPEKKWREIVRNLPSERYIEVKYEELVNNPTRELKKICTFLHLDFDAEMLNVDQNTTYSKPDPKYAEQWKEKLTNREIIAVESQCREYMTDAGYSIKFPSKKYDPGFFTRLFYKVDSRIRRILFNIKRYGFPLWFGYIVFKRLPIKAPKVFFISRKNAIDRLHLK